jgi:hypothetical protein
MFRLLAIVSTNDVLNFSMPKFFRVADRTIDNLLLTYITSYSIHIEMEQEAFLSIAFSCSQEKYLQITSIPSHSVLQNALPFHFLSHQE